MAPEPLGERRVAGGTPMAPAGTMQGRRRTKLHETASLPKAHPTPGSALH